jgi:hypothetical protein
MSGGSDCGGSSDLKERGNQCIRDGNALEAVRWYTLAMHQSSSSSAVLHGNRSTALHHLRHYKLALLDAFMATQADPQWFKGYLLKGKCLLSLHKV